ncbi:MAG: sugar nucleotide-binding protein, partial [Gammaproteobacteria bacterium]
WARWLAQATGELLRKRDVIAHHGGIFHLAAAGHATRYEFAEAVIEFLRDGPGGPGGWAKLRPIKTAQYPLPARRPPRPVLNTSRIERVFGIAPRAWRDQLHEFLRELAKSTSLGV